VLHESEGAVALVRDTLEDTRDLLAERRALLEHAEFVIEIARKYQARRLAPAAAGYVWLQTDGEEAAMTTEAEKREKEAAKTEADFQKRADERTNLQSPDDLDIVTAGKDGPVQSAMPKDPMTLEERLSRGQVVPDETPQEAEDRANAEREKADSKK
jgi:hypothetical protein